MDSDDPRKGQGVKYDGEKLRYDLVPVSFVRAVATILTHGAKKYDDNNWRHGMRWGRVYAAMMRHIEDWRAGEDIDPESGHHHLWHAACNLAFLIEYTQQYPEGDDRFHVQGFVDHDDAHEV